MSRTMNRAARRTRQGKGKRIGLSHEQVEARKTQLRGVDKYRRRSAPYDADGRPRTFAASEYWINEQLPVVRDKKPDGKLITYRLFAPYAVPIGVVRCPKCGHQSPPQLIGSSGHCMDCRFGYGPRLPAHARSISVVDMRQMKHDSEGLQEVTYTDA